MNRPESVGSLNLPFVEEVYAEYLANPANVDPDWRRFFEAFGNGEVGGDWTPPGRVVGRGVSARPQGPMVADGNGLPRSLPQMPAGEELAPEPVDLDDATLREAVAFLRRVSLFKSMREDELAEVARLARPVHFEAGATLCYEGEVGNAAYIVTRGRVVIRRDNLVLTELGVGEVVGELAVIDNQPRSADVLAEGPVDVLEIRASDFQQLLDSRKGLARGLLRVLISRMRDTSFRQARVDMLVRAFRVRGHVQASLDPLGRNVRHHPELTLEHYGLAETDLDKFFAVQIGDDYAVRSLREALETLRTIYCGAIGAQYMHIDDLDVQGWLRRRLENVGERRRLSRAEQLRILEKLTDAEIFEQFLHRKFVGAKRFSLEGAESLIPLLHYAIEEAGQHGVEEIVIGMPHRGRLNVLANILGKPARQIFREFQDVDPELYKGRGDVKYHMGHSSDRETASGQRVHLSLCFNPSHLGFVGAVALGRTRAKQDRRGDADRSRVMPLIMHGDAAFTGQGVTQELFNMSELEGYTTGGAVHVIVNNQIGFTTLPEEARSSPYCTDVARMLQIPIFHVNGEQPDAVARVIRMAMDFRFAFKRDVVIDMYCYRKYGHNEGDDPTFTQPVMYSAIANRKTVLEAFTDNLLTFGEVTREEAESIAERSRAALDEELESSKQEEYEFVQPEAGRGLWADYYGGPDESVPDVPTGVAKERLRELLRACTELDGHNPNKKIRRLFEQRREMAEGERPLDWGAAETLAYATLVTQGERVRLTGQDVKRGTFSHRHAVVFDQDSGEGYVALAHLSPDQAPFEVYNSPLTETGVLGFEYGFSLDYPDGLMAWEAQFGDFANVGQVIIDQFITSSEDKWRRLASLVMLLPHGFEGQGPEHSSARLERFLQLAAEDNIQVVNPTTPAQFFHCLRRQVVRPWRKPLVVMSPKSLLRHPECVSSLDDLAIGTYRRVIGDDLEQIDLDRVRRVVLCSGKVYYDLAQARRASERRDVALVRLEQYYPLPKAALSEELSRFPKDTPVVWVQEEPLNMGAWGFLKWRLGESVEGNGIHPLTCVSRVESASPATGSAAAHKMEQAELMANAFAS